MRGVWLALILLVSASPGWADLSLPAIPAGQLVREVVYNELNDHQDHGYYRYWVKRVAQNQVFVEEQVETPHGPVTRLIERNEQPLDANAERLEEERLERLLTSPEEQARHLKQYQDDEQRIGRILELLPDAFVYQYDGIENGAYRLRFKPNPAYTAQTIEARIFHAMQGAIWIDARTTRLVRLEGRIQQNVDFGFGILGRLYQGGWFRLVRVQVNPTDWKTESLEVHLTIRALLVKSFARETSEERGGFEPVPSGLNLAQGMALLDQTQARADTLPETQPPATHTVPAQAVFAATH